MAVYVNVFFLMLNTVRNKLRNTLKQDRFESFILIFTEREMT